MLSCAILIQQKTVNASVTTFQQFSPNTTSNSTFNSKFPYIINDNNTIAILVYSLVAVLLFVFILCCCFVSHGQCYGIRSENPMELVRLIF